MMTLAKVTTHFIATVSHSPAEAGMKMMPMPVQQVITQMHDDVSFIERALPVCYCCCCCSYSASYLSLSCSLSLSTNDTANTRTINGDIKKYNDSSVSKAKQKHHCF